MKFLPIVMLLVLAGCSSLPSHPDTTGAAVLPLEFRNSSSQTVPIHKVDLVLSNGRSLIFEPRDGILVIPVGDPDLKIVGVRIALRLEHWSGTDNVVPVDLPLSTPAGQVRVLPYCFQYSQENDTPKSGSFWSSWKLVPYDVDTADRVRTRVEADPEFARWRWVTTE